MLRKIAIFVEGNTELLLVEKLVIQLVGFHKIHISERRIHGDQTINIRTVGIDPTDENTEFYILIMNCEGDGKVKSAITERLDSLVGQGYEMILGLRDVHPHFSRDEIPKLREKVNSGLQAAGVSASIILAIMEIESWLLGEWTLFQRFDPNLTLDLIRTGAGIHLNSVQPEEIENPATQLKKILQLVGYNYTKSSDDAHALISRIDYELFYLEVRQRIPSLDEFLSSLDSFFTPVATSA